MTVACIVQARLGSTRLPAKVLLPLPTGRTVLEEVLHRCKQIPGVDFVIAAVPEPNESPGNEIVTEAAIREVNVVIYGPEHDVLARYLKAADAVGADVIVRVTSDCPMIDPEVCGQVLAYQKRHGFDYVSNSWPTRTFPHGFDCEVFAAWALRSAVENADAYGVTDEDREHVGPAIRRVVGNVEMDCFTSPIDRSHIRWTLDTLSDYRHIYAVMAEQMREAA